MKQLPSMVGRWKKQLPRDPRQEVYPDILEFQPNGLYNGTPAARDHFVIWDVGRYVVESPEQVKLSTANDAEISYRFELSGDEFWVDDGQGNRIRYVRIKEK